MCVGFYYTGRRHLEGGDEESAKIEVVSAFRGQFKSERHSGPLKRFRSPDCDILW